MNRAVNDGGFFANVLHNVDFATGWPRDLIDVGSQHPEGRPNALSAGNLDACLETPVGLRELALRLQSGGRIVPAHAVGAGVFFFNNLDDELPIMQVRILRTGGIGLQFVVAPSPSAGF